MNNSEILGSVDVQSASLPGRLDESRALFLLVRSLAFLAAMRERAATFDSSMIFFAAVGCSSRYTEIPSETTDSTNPCISLSPSLVLVCPSNWGSGRFTDITAVNPSRISSPRSLGSLCFIRLWSLEY